MGEVKWIETDLSVLFCMPRLCSPKRSLMMLPVGLMYCEGRVLSFLTSFAVNHVNQVIRGTKEIVLVCPVL